MTQTIRYLLIVVAILYCVNSSQHAPDYVNQDKWPELCNKGVRQSPINILMAHVNICPPNNEFKFQTDNALINIHADVKAKNLMNKFQDQTFVTWKSNGTESRYASVQYHWHFVTEHQIDGKNFDLQLHIVHKSLTTPGSLAVIGIMFKTSPDGTVTMFKNHDYTSTEDKPVKFPLDLKGKSFFHYKGSLTTPPCSQTVEWFVYEDQFPITKDQLEYMRSFLNDGNANNRKIQKLNKRSVDYFPTSCSSTLPNTAPTKV